MLSKAVTVVVLSALGTAVAGCGGSAASTPPARSPGPVALHYRVVNTYPHDPGAFTEGLAIDGGRLYESTGAYRQVSSLRVVDLTSGRVMRKVDISPDFFAEGLTLFDGRAIQLTWRSQVGVVYDESTLQQIGSFRYATEGWGLTQDGRSLIMSDGTDVLRFLDPATYAVQRALKVTQPHTRVSMLNELEYVNGSILANVFDSNTILRIDPESGAVTGTLDLSALDPHLPGSEAVLNGIAYDSAADRLFVTGKLWPQLFEIRLSG